MIAQKFMGYEHDDRFLIFASGVSNSKNTDPAHYLREKELLEEAVKNNPNKTIVYFSTCSVYDPAEVNSPYVLHKKQLEDIIQALAANYVIFRASNVVGISPNPNTIFNFLSEHIRNGSEFDLWLNATRNLIDIEDVYLIINEILLNGLFKNSIVNIANPTSYKVTDIVTAIEQHYRLEAKYRALNKGGSFDIDIDAIKPIIESLGIDFGNDYLHRLLLKSSAS